MKLKERKPLPPSPADIRADEVIVDLRERSVALRKAAEQLSALAQVAPTRANGEGTST